ncbi:MAG: phage tail tape measure protein [Planctomycetota bacterium]
MASTGEIKAGQAFVEITARTEALQAGLKGAQKKIKDFSSVVTGLGLKLSALGAAASAPLAAGTAEFASFEKEFVRLGTVLDEPEKHLESFKKGLGDLAVETGKSSVELSQALFAILSAGIAPEKALEVLAVSAKAANAGSAELATTVDSVTRVLGAYGLGAERAGDVSDFLFATIRRGRLSMEDLSSSLGAVLPLASSAGVSLEEVGAVLATLTRAGVKAETASMSLNAVLADIIDPSEEASAAAEALGITLSTAGLQSEGLVGILQKLGGLSPEDVAKVFPSVRALKGVLPAIRNLEALGDNLAAISNRAGATEKAASAMSGTLQGGFNKVRRTLEETFLVIGEALVPTQKKILGFVQVALKGFRGFLQGNQELIVTFAKITTLVGILGAGLTALGAAGVALSSVFGGLSTMVGAAGTILFKVVGIVTTLLSPIGLLATASLVLGVSVLKSTGIIDEALRFAQERFGEFKDTALQTWSAISQAFAAGDLKGAIRVLVAGLKLEFAQGIESLKTLWLTFKDAFLTIFHDTMFAAQALFIDSWFDIQDVFSRVTSALAQTWLEFAGRVKGIWNDVTSAVAKGFLEIQGLADSSLDVEAAKRTLEEHTQIEKKRIEDETVARSQSLADQRGREQADLEGRRRESLAFLGRERAGQEAGQSQQFAVDLLAAQSELEKARGEFQRAVRATGAQETRTGARKPELDIEALKKELLGVGDAVAGARSQTLDIQGTFNAATAETLGASGLEERTAKATEETARNTQKLLREVINNPLEFS